LRRCRRRAADARWHDGRSFSGVDHAGDEHTAFLKQASDSGLALDDGCERDLGLFSWLTSSLTPAT